MTASSRSCLAEKENVLIWIYHVPVYSAMPKKLEFYLMPAANALLFIDANKYLDLYRTDKGRKLLGPLTEQAAYIFITQQVVEEVQRNKLTVTAEFLRTKSQGMKLQSISVPDHFSGSESGSNNEILRKMKEVSNSVSTLNAKIDSHTLEIMNQISESKDEVSKALSPIFSKAIRATGEELKRARERKEVGKPPGKRNDPLGDEITWEQILSKLKGKSRLWIISRDGDYGIEFGGSIFLNGFLRAELAQTFAGVSIFLFKDLVEGLTHFVETTGVKADAKLTPQEVTEIEAEERSLPSMDSRGHATPSPVPRWSGAEINQGLAAMQSSAELKMALAAMQPSAELKAALAAMQPSAELKAALAAMQPSAELKAALAAMQPSAELKKALTAMQSSAATTKTIAKTNKTVRKDRK